jgi:glycosyltransferase involved in cell wall biosynthesis
VVTPSYNQAAYLEETLRSVLLQGCPNLEYRVMDGGSQDGSADLVRRYAPWLAGWVSERDAGQAAAINRGLRQATGEVLAWLNSDDAYLPGTVATVMRVFAARPEVDVVYGSAVFVNEAGEHLGTYAGRPLARGVRRMQYWRGWPLPQPTAFFRRRLLEAYGLLNEAFHYAVDYEWFVRLSEKATFVCLDDTLATYRLHTHSKTGQWDTNKRRFYAECRQVNLLHAPPLAPRSWPLWLSHAWDNASYRAGRLAEPRIDGRP